MNVCTYLNEWRFVRVLVRYVYMYVCMYVYFNESLMSMYVCIPVGSRRFRSGLFLQVQSL